MIIRRPRGNRPDRQLVNMEGALSSGDWAGATSRGYNSPVVLNLKEILESLERAKNSEQYA